MKRLLAVVTRGSVLQMAEPWRDGAAVIFDRPRENQLILERLDARRFHSLRVLFAESGVHRNCFAHRGLPDGAAAAGNVFWQRWRKWTRSNGCCWHRRWPAAKTGSDEICVAEILPCWMSCRRDAPKARRWQNGRALQGLQREEILAVGDNHNDLEMLEFAGIPVVMGNSVPELKTYGWHETAFERRRWSGRSDREVRTAARRLRAPDTRARLRRWFCLRASGVVPFAPTISYCAAAHGSM